MRGGLVFFYGGDGLEPCSADCIDSDEVRLLTT